MRGRGRRGGGEEKEDPTRRKLYIMRAGNGRSGAGYDRECLERAGGVLPQNGRNHVSMEAGWKSSLCE